METINLPSHVAIIMDGNGRWATMRGKLRSFGHKKGSENVETIVEHAFDSGINALTLYAFSCENWSRPKDEVDALMRLLKDYLGKFAKKLAKNNIKLRVIGDRNGLSEELLQAVDKAENITKDGEKVLNIAINYGARQEIVRVVNNLIQNNEPITIENISQNLDTACCGEPDLIIRTGGEYRLSNFLLYQGAYSEFYFTDALWPDFNEQEFDKAMLSFSQRKRRFGKV